MTVTDDQDISLGALAVEGRAMPLVPDLADQSIDTVPDLLGALAAGAPVRPDVPGQFLAALGAQGVDLGRCDTLIRAVVPLGDQRRHRRPRIRLVRLGLRVHHLPRVRCRAAQVEELECALGTAPGGDVAKKRVVSGEAKRGVYNREGNRRREDGKAASVAGNFTYERAAWGQ